MCNTLIKSNISDMVNTIVVSSTPCNEWYSSSQFQWWWVLFAQVVVKPTTIRSLLPLFSTGYSYNEPKHLIGITFFIKDLDIFALLLSSWNFCAASFAVFRLTSNSLCHWQIALSRFCKSLVIDRSNSYLVALLLVTQHTWKLGNKTIIKFHEQVHLM